MFLADFDYETFAGKNELGLLTSDSPHVRADAELAAVEEAKSYLTAFDLDKIFLDIVKWDEDTAYATDALAIYRNRPFIAKQANTGSVPDETPDDWAEGDKRNRLLVMYVIDMVLYHLYAKVPSKSVPENRIARYEKAIKWLEDVSANRLSVTLQRLAEDEGSTMKLGSNNKKKHGY